MSSSSSPRTATRVATALAAAAAAGVLVAAPASARQDPGTGGADHFTGTSTSSGPTQLQPPQGPSVPTQDGGTEYVQVGAGLLAGLALAGAGVAVASRRRPRGMTPA